MNFLLSFLRKFNILVKIVLVDKGEGSIFFNTYTRFLWRNIKNNVKMVIATSDKLYYLKG